MELPARRKHQVDHIIGERKQSVQKMGFRFPVQQQRSDIRIPLVRQNMHLIFRAGIENDAMVPDVNPVAVHTPVVCVGMSGDEIAFVSRLFRAK